MPEGPEVRRYAEAIARAIEGEPILDISARTRAARAWLEARHIDLVGRVVTSVRSHGKHLVGRAEGGFYFHAHLMMWGRWEVHEGVPPDEVDRRERARIVTPRATAILMSAPVFDVGEGEPYEEVEHLATLGPDALPYPDAGPFDAEEVVVRLRRPENLDRAIGVALLDQRIVAGLGNYLRAEVLFECRIDPWRAVGDLTVDELACLLETIPAVTSRALATGGATVPDEVRERMRDDAALVYQPGRDYGTRHWVFRRTNLPCLECDDVVRQLRQTTSEDEEDERSRIIYFCPTCQGTSVAVKPPRRRERVVA
jgi:formamidopyrimidine-DNA glycosylase